MKQNQNLKEIEVKHIISQLLLGLNEIHSSNILHRDLRPSNIFVNTIDASEVKIFSFLKSQTNSISETS